MTIRCFRSIKSRSIHTHPLCLPSKSRQLVKIRVRHLSTRSSITDLACVAWWPPSADRPLVTPVAGMSQALPQTQFGLLRSMDWAGDASNHTRFDTHFVEVQSVGLNAMRWSGDFEERRQIAERQGRDYTPGVADRRVDSHGGLLSPRQPTTDDGNHVMGSFRQPRSASAPRLASPSSCCPARTAASLS